jgi:hypothetical protein
MAGLDVIARLFDARLILFHKADLQGCGRGAFKNFASSRRAGPIRSEQRSHVKNLAVTRLDLVGTTLDAGRIIFHGLDFAQRLAS